MSQPDHCQILAKDLRPPVGMFVAMLAELTSLIAKGRAEQRDAQAIAEAAVEVFNNARADFETCLEKKQVTRWLESDEVGTLFQEFAQQVNLAEDFIHARLVELKNSANTGKTKKRVPKRVPRLVTIQKRCSSISEEVTKISGKLTAIVDRRSWQKVAVARLGDASLKGAEKGCLKGSTVFIWTICLIIVFLLCRWFGIGLESIFKYFK